MYVCPYIERTVTEQGDSKQHATCHAGVYITMLARMHVCIPYTDRCHGSACAMSLVTLQSSNWSRAMPGDPQGISAKVAGSEVVSG